MSQTFEDLFYDYLKDAKTGAQLDELKGDIESELSQAEDRVVEENDLWED